MMIVCPSCSTSYRIELSMLGPAGRQVRCSRCKSVWLATVDNVVMADLTQDAMAAGPPAGDNAMPRWGVGGQFAPDQESHDLAGIGIGSPESFAGIPHTADAPPMAPAPELDHVVVEPSLQASHHAEIVATPAEDIETVAARRERDRRAKRGAKQPFALRLPSIPMPFVVVVLVAAIGLLLNFRHSVVNAFPQTASLFRTAGFAVNLRGLAFEQVKSTKDMQDGVAILNVEGVIANVAGRPMDIPRLRFSLRNGAGREIYTWTALPTRETLGAGETLPFRSRLASPPAEGQDVLVRFFNKRDAIAGGGASPAARANGVAEPKRTQ